MVRLTALRGRGTARLRARGGAMLEEAAERSRPRAVAEPLRENWRWFAQAALATAPWWALAEFAFGHDRPIFAPVAGLVAVSTTLGQRRRYAVEDGARRRARDRDSEPAEAAWTRASEIDPDVLQEAIAAGAKRCGWRRGCAARAPSWSATRARSRRSTTR